MSRFYLTTSNSRGNAVTAAGQSSGQSVHIRGWKVGVSVSGVPDGDEDVFHIYSTAGSGYGNGGEYLGHVRLVDDVPTFFARERIVA